MAQSEKVKELLKRLEEGTGEIYARYESLMKTSDAGYNAKITQLESDYQRAAGQASAQAKIDLKNTLEKMADAGYLNSGETVQATIAANANKAAALSALSVQKAKDKKEYEDQKSKARESLALQSKKEAQDFESQISEAVRQQENLDREYEAQERQRAYEKEQQEANLKLEQEMAAAKVAQIAAETKKAQEEVAKIAAETKKMQQETAIAAATQAQKAEESKKESGIQPKKTPYEYVDDIVEKNTKYYKKKGYKVIDRKAILLAISSVVKDTKIAYAYRYEMYLYGKSLGYIK